MSTIVPKLSGVWVLNETIELISPFPSGSGYRWRTFVVNFSSDGRTFGSVDFTTDTSGKGLIFKWFQSDGSAVKWVYIWDNVGYELYYPSLGWQDEAYRTVDFGAEPQEVDPDFYAWLTANANPIPVNPPDPLSLVMGYRVGCAIRANR